jgi:2'-hydroxyisoflavone reductase
VIDVWPDEPSMVTATAQLLAPRAGYYFFMSSIAAYANFDVPGLVETSPTRLQAAGYGGNKARSERALMELTQGRAGIARGSPIMGPRDTSFSFYYWLYKLSRNEPFVAPGDGNDVLQYVDVRDVARWIVDCAERRRPGFYNTFSRPIPFRTFFREAAIGIGGHGRPVWVDETFLRETEKIHPLDNMPVWHPDRPGFARISTAKAEAAGWTQRPLVQTARDTWASYRTWVPANLTFPQKDGSFEWGISREREQAILADWQRRRAAAAQASTAEAAT